MSTIVILYLSSLAFAQLEESVKSGEVVVLTQSAITLPDRLIKVIAIVLSYCLESLHEKNIFPFAAFTNHLC